MTISVLMLTVTAMVGTVLIPAPSRRLPVHLLLLTTLLTMNVLMSMATAMAGMGLIPAQLRNPLVILL